MYLSSPLICLSTCIMDFLLRANKWTWHKYSVFVKLDPMKTWMNIQINGNDNQMLTTYRVLFPY